MSPSILDSLRRLHAHDRDLSDRIPALLRANMAGQTDPMSSTTAGPKGSTRQLVADSLPGELPGGGLIVPGGVEPPILPGNYGAGPAHGQDYATPTTNPNAGQPSYLPNGNAPLPVSGGWSGQEPSLFGYTSAQPTADYSSGLNGGGYNGPGTSASYALPTSDPDFGNPNYIGLGNSTGGLSPRASGLIGRGIGVVTAPWTGPLAPLVGLGSGKLINKLFGKGGVFTGGGGSPQAPTATVNAAGIASGGKDGPLGTVYGVDPKTGYPIYNGGRVGAPPPAPAGVPNFNAMRFGAQWNGQGNIGRQNVFDAGPGQPNIPDPSRGLEMSLIQEDGGGPRHSMPIIPRGSLLGAMLGSRAGVGKWG